MMKFPKKNDKVLEKIWEKDESYEKINEEIHREFYRDEMKERNKISIIKNNCKYESFASISLANSFLSMKIYCKCKNEFFIEADMIFNVKCPACEKTYACIPNIELYELKNKPKKKYK